MILLLAQEYVYLVIISIVSIVISPTFVLNADLDFTSRRRYAKSALKSAKIVFQAVFAQAVY